jgi:hypothetical protein
LSGNFKETDDGFIPLKDVRTKDFDVFVDWIYEKRLPEGIEGPDVYLLPIHEYVLADMLLASGLKKAAFDVMFDLFVKRCAFPRYPCLALCSIAFPSKILSSSFSSTFLLSTEL